MPCRPVNTLSRRAHPESVPTNKRRQRHLQVLLGRALGTQADRGGKSDREGPLGSVGAGSPCLVCSGALWKGGWRLQHPLVWWHRGPLRPADCSGPPGLA